MSIDKINSISLFQPKKTQGYTPQAIPSAPQGRTQGANPFAQGISEVAQIGADKKAGFECGVGGTNSPTETCGNKFMAVA